MITRMMKYWKLTFTFIVIIMNFGVNSIHSQEIITAEISDKIELKYEFDTLENKEYIFEATLKLHNPSMVYPLEVIMNSASSRNLKLEKLNDSTYSIQTIFDGEINHKSELIVLCEILAGNDSICRVTFENVNLDSVNFTGKEFIIKVNTLNNELPYLRFTKILKVYPNPVLGNSTLYIEYVCDVKGEVEFYLSGLLGQYYFLKKTNIETTGLQKDFIDFNHVILSGSYRIEIRTKFGRVSKPFTIIK